MNVSWPMKGFFVRKETKEYGKKELIEGHLTADDNVILLEDVTTTGGSLLRAVEEVQKVAKVSGVVTIVDRNQGADKLFESKGIPFKAILNINQIL
jgi:orotate phosphoribosyltransferase